MQHRRTKYLWKCQSDVILIQSIMTGADLIVLKVDSRWVIKRFGKNERVKNAVFPKRKEAIAYAKTLATVASARIFVLEDNCMVCRVI